MCELLLIALGSRGAWSWVLLIALSSVTGLKGGTLDALVLQSSVVPASLPAQRGELKPDAS